MALQAQEFLPPLWPCGQYGGCAQRWVGWGLHAPTSECVCVCVHPHRVLMPAECLCRTT